MDRPWTGSERGYMSDRRRDDRIFDPDYVADLGSLSTDEIRKRRWECDTVEAEVSYARRLLQGRVDILSHELERRARGGEPKVDELREKLPHILAPPRPSVDRDSCGSGRHNRVVEPPDPEQQRRDVDQMASTTTLAHLSEKTTKEIDAIVERLAAAEADASEKRKKVQEVLDALTGELVRRYKQGDEIPTQLLSR